MEKKIYNKVADLQDDAIVLENSNPPLLLWCVYIFLTIGICIAVIGACVFEIDKVVTAEGKLETLRPNIVLKPFDRVVIKQVHVRVGDVVKKGQLLSNFQFGRTSTIRATATQLFRTNCQTQGRIASKRLCV